MSNDEHLSPFNKAFRGYFERSPLSYKDLAKKADIPKQTLVNWGNGNVAKPSRWADILKLAEALNLSELETTGLLELAGFPPVDELLETATAPEEQKLLVGWEPEVRERLRRLRFAPWQILTEDPLFHGREAEFKAVVAHILGGARRCVIIGTIGVGKSALATQVARRLLRHFPDGVVLADVGANEVEDQPAAALDARTREAQITLARAFNVDFGEVGDLAARAGLLRSELSRKQALIILDDVRDAIQLQNLIPETGPTTCAVIITTHNQHVAKQFKQETVQLDPFDDETGAELLSIVIDDPTLTEGAGADQALKDISRYVGGLPLALRVAGRNIGGTRPVTLREYCDQVLVIEPSLLDALDEGMRRENVRHVLEAGYRQLSPERRFVFAVAGAFMGDSFTAEAMTHVLRANPEGVSPPITVPRVRVPLGELVTFSLMQRTNDPHTPETPQRYHYQALLRALAREKLAGEFGERQAAVFYSVADYYRTLCLDCPPERYGALDAEWSNIQAALKWYSDEGMWLEFLGLLLSITAPSLGTLGYMDTVGRWVESAQWIERGLDWALEIPDRAVIAEIRFRRGVFALRQGKLSEARQDLLQAKELFAAATADDEETRLRQAQVGHFLSQLEVRERHAEDALGWLDEAARLLEGLPGENARHEEGYTYIRKGSALGMLGRIPEVQPELARGLGMLPDRPTTARASGLMSMGTLNAMMGNRPQAIAAWNGALEDARALGDKRQQLNLFRNLANMQAEHGEFGPAIEAYLGALDLYDQIGDTEGQGLTASNLGLAYLEWGKPDEAAPYLERAKWIGDSHGLREVRVQARVNLAQWRLGQDDAAGAEALLQEAEVLDMPGSLAEIRRIQARAALQSGRPAEAQARAEEAIQAAREAESAQEEGRAQRVLAEALSRQEQWDAAAAAYAAAGDCLAGNAYQLALTQASRAAHLPAAG